MSSSVVTASFGTHAASVAAHFWNVREDDSDENDEVDWNVDHAERARVNEGSTSISYVPRWVAFDARSLRGKTTATGLSSGDAAAAAAAAAWSGAWTVTRAPPTRRSAYARALEREAKALKSESALRALVGDEEEEDGWSRSKLGVVGRALELRASGGVAADPLDDMEDVSRALIEAAEKLDVDAEHWSDYLKVELCERNEFALAGKWTGINAFDGFGEGTDWIESEDRREDVRDAIRYWVEGCDVLGGFRILCDDLSGFGGVCAKALEDVRDYYNNRTVFVFSTRPPAKKERKRMDMLNAAFAATSLAASSDLYCPLAACDDYSPTLRVHEDSWFHTSAVCALAIEGITTPWRLKRDVNGASNIHEMCKFMTARAPGPFASVKTSVPAPGIRGASDADTLLDSMRFVSPGVRAPDGEDDAPFSEFFIARGLSTDSTVVASTIDAMTSRELYRCPRRRCVVSTEVPIPLPFPRIFPSGRPSSVRSLTRLTTSSSTTRDLTRIHTDFARASVSSVGKTILAQWSCDAVERAEIVENLCTRARAYAGDDDADDF